MSALETALEKKRKYLITAGLPDLKAQYNIFMVAFQSLYNLLLRKALINEDPYQYDKNMSEVTTPPTEPFPESEKKDHLSIRLANFGSQLEFLNSYYQFSLEFLNLDRIKRLVSLNKYMKWEKLATTSSDPNTRIVAEACNKIKQGSDTVAAAIVSDSEKQITMAKEKTLSLLKELTNYLRELYKYEIRGNFFRELYIPANELMSSYDRVIGKIKQEFHGKMGNKPYYPGLIKEALDEDFSVDSQELRQTVLAKLKTEEQQKQTKKKKITFKEILLEAVRLLATSSNPLLEIQRKFQENHAVLSHRKLAFKEKFRRWLLKVIGQKIDAQIFEIEIFDEYSATSKVEKLNFNEFMAKIAKLAAYLSHLSNRMSVAYKRLEVETEEKINQVLARNVEEVQRILRRLPAIDTYFKTELPRSQRAGLKGVKIEISTIKSSLIKANKKRHEYMSQKEELEQLKKLGISEEQL